MKPILLALAVMAVTTGCAARAQIQPSAAQAQIQPGAAQAPQEQPSTGADQTGLAVTIYNGDLALVKDARRIKLVNGENLLAWREVSARIQPETALLRALDGRRLSLLEQNFDFDLLSPAKMLEESVGDTVRVIRTHPGTGAETSETATVLAANNGVVLKFADRVETGIPGRLAFAAVPAHLRERPTLSMLLRSEASTDGAASLELSYLTGGLGWKADYVAELSEKEERMDLNGWVTLTNASGAAYPNARLQLVAGSVNRVQPERLRMPVMAKAMAMADGAAEMREEGLFEYHLYTLTRPTTLLDNQTKQVALLTAQKVPVAKEYRLSGGDWYYTGQYSDLGQKLKPVVFMAFSNKGDTPAAGSLGLPLPKGIVRVYKKDSAGRAQFIGEDRIDHTAKGELVRLKLGEAFDISADKKQTDFQKLASTTHGGLIETAYQIEIRNAKSEPVTVTVVEPMPGEWKMLQESHPHKKDAAHSATWNIPVPAEGAATLTWRVRVKY